MPEDDVERWAKIRDRQIAARDPSEVIKKRTQRVQYRHKGRGQRLTMKEVVRVFSWKLIGAIIGLIVALVAWLVLGYYVQAGWVNWAGLIMAVLFGALGVLIGASFDWRDDLRDF